MIAMAKKSYPGSNFLTVFAVVILLHQVEADNNREVMSVTIVNELPDALGVGCQSRDDKLGFRLIQPERGSYHFTFHSNLWGSTLFTCTFTWEIGTGARFPSGQTMGCSGERRGCVSSASGTPDPTRSTALRNIQIVSPVNRGGPTSAHEFTVEEAAAGFDDFLLMLCAFLCCRK